MAGVLAVVGRVAALGDGMPYLHHRVTRLSDRHGGPGAQRDAAHPAADPAFKDERFDPASGHSQGQPRHLVIADESLINAPAPALARRQSWSKPCLGPSLVLRILRMLLLSPISVGVSRLLVHVGNVYR